MATTMTMSNVVPPFSLSINLLGSDCNEKSSRAAHPDNNLQPPPPVPPTLISSFESNGFVILENVLDALTVQALNERLEEVLRGRHDRGCMPDKQPKLIKSEREVAATTTMGNIDGNNGEHARLSCSATSETETSTTTTDTETESQSASVERNDNNDSNARKDNKKKRRNKNKAAAIGPLGFSGNLNNVKVLQIINIHKSDKLFRALATFEGIGRVVAELAGWKNGARLAQDQIWAKPPAAPPLVFHRDTPYFMFTPLQVVTVWVALDDMDEEIGPLEYVVGSHKWGDGRVGSSNQFFQSKNSLLKSAAEREGLNAEELNIVSTSGLKAGGLSIHDGKTWHGSGRNASKTRPRRGIGLHFVPAEVKFTNDAKRSRLWRAYVDHADDASTVELSLEDFPIVWQP